MLRKIQNIILSKASKKTGIAFADQMVVSGSHFLVQIIVARALDLTNYGVFSAIWLALLFVSTFHQAFIISPMLTLASGKHKSYFTNVQLLQWITNGILALAILPFYFLNSHQNYLEDNALILSAAFAIIAYICYDFYRKQCYVKEQYLAAFVSDVLVYTVQILALFYFYWIDSVTIANALTIISISYALGILSEFVRSNFLARSAESAPNLGKEKFNQTLKSHWQFSNWLIAKSGLQWLSGNFFLVAATSILGAAALGAIKMAQNVIGIFNVFYLTLENVVPVKAANVYNSKGSKQLQNYFSNLSKIGLPLITIAILILALLAEPMLNLIYAEVNLETVRMFRGFCILYVLVYISTLKRIHIKTILQTKQIFIAYLISAVLALVMAYPLVNILKLDGVIIGIILSQLVSLIYYTIFLNKKNNSYESYTFGIGQSQS